MTFCKHTKNRIVPIQYDTFDDKSFCPSDNFSLFLIKKGSIILNVNEKECFISSNAVICSSFFDKLKLVYQSEAEFEILRFAPEFINVNLTWDIIKHSDYKKLCEKYEYPDLKLFLERSLIYNGILILDEDGFNKVSELLNLIKYQLTDQPDAKWSCRSRGLLFHIMDILNFYYRKFTNGYLKDPLVMDMCQYINLNLASVLSLDLFSRLFSVNRTSLAERFKAATKLTISEYIKEKRIAHVKHLLAFTELRLSEIGRRVGFHDQTYLSKMFLKAVGITPLEYRKKMKNARPQKLDKL